MKIAINLNTVLIIGLIVTVVLLQRCGSRVDVNALKGQLAAKDSVITEKQRRIDDKEQHNLELDKSISAYDRRDSLYAEYFKSRPQVYKKLNDQLSQIPIRIAAIAGNDDSIHAALAR